MEIQEFDKSVFSKNLAYLLKQNNMTIGQLETAINISAGYISRTVNPDSDKKLSIDAMWKIAKLFNVSIDDIITMDFTDKSAVNTDMAVEFINKLRKDTLSDKVSWLNKGGCSSEFNPEQQALGFSFDESDGVYFTQPEKGLLARLITDDIYALENTIGGKTLMIVPYHIFADTQVHYRLFFSYKSDSDAGYECEEFLDSADAVDDILDECAGILYYTIKNRCNDIHLGNSAIRFIQSYMGK